MALDGPVSGDVIASILTYRDWMPSDRTDHMLHCRRLRRAPDQGVSDAHQVIRAMSYEQSVSELRATLCGDLARITPPTSLSQQQQGGWWGLGTILPPVVSTDLNRFARVSAWMAVLVWESQRWLGSASVQRFQRGSTLHESTVSYSLYLPLWDGAAPCEEIRLMMAADMAALARVERWAEWALAQRVAKPKYREFWPVRAWARLPV